ncbi:MAG: cytochrome c [Cystobacterineae bacterium]|nr:cytochrome c [Cystobacterineae bacterium]
MSSPMVFRISVLALAIATTAQAESELPVEFEAASKLFGLKGKGCSSCHTIGNGDKTGPDLKEITRRREKAWVKRFVNAPAEVISSGDAVAVELVQKFKGLEMAPQDLEESEFESLWSYWTYCDGLKEACIPYDGPKWGTDATPEEVALGAALFEGRAGLENGGPSCLGCHHVRGMSIWGGGSVGPDLTFAYARLGENKLVPALEEMSTPMMKALYGKAPLTPTEQYQIKAFLADVARDGSISNLEGTHFLYLGLEGMGLVVGLALILWSRKRGNA